MGYALAFLIFINLVFPKNAFAYLDMGTGSYMFQLMIGFLAGFLFSIKLFWGRIKNFFKNVITRKKKN